MNHRLLNHLTNHNNNNNENSRLLQWHYSELDDHNFQIHGQTLFYLFILFSIILLVTLLLLYARWYFRFRHAHHVPPHTTTTTYPHVPLPHAGPTSRRGLHPLAIKAIPIILHQVQDDSDNNNNNNHVNGIIIEECCICLGVFEDGDKVKVLPKCDHRFHSECVDRWLLTQSSCPLCRLSFRVDPVPLDSVILPPV